MDAWGQGGVPFSGNPGEPAARFCYSRHQVRTLAILIPLLVLTASQPKPDPGRVTARRLNRAEYNYSIHDLLGVDPHPADDFPPDDSGYGFDNIADVLSLSPVLMESYLNAAEKVAHEAVFGPAPMQATVVRYTGPRRAESSTGVPTGADDTGLGLASSLHARHEFPVSATYKFVIQLDGFWAGGTYPLRVGVWVDGKQVGATETQSGAENGKRAQVSAAVTAGQHTISASFLRLFRTEGNNVRVSAIEIGGPFDVPKGPSPESLRLVYSCGHLDGHHDASCPRKIVSALARRAFRRPVTAQEVDRLTGWIARAQQDGGSFEDGVALAIQAMLVSPGFLFRIEKNAAGAAVAGAPAFISQYDLASRLSYFLWSSIPDENLLSAAAAGTLHKPAVLRAQVRRMLRDPKSSRLVENFAGQWLQIRALESVKPDRKRFPEFDDYVRFSMRRETESFFENVVDHDLSILDFLDAPYSFLNQRMAELYQVPGVTGQEFRKVDFSKSPPAAGARAGVLTQASVLTVSSYANRTSPVLRGKWILSELLDAAPPPPPPDVPNLDEAAVGTSMSMRQQMEKHRTNPVCASCHVIMDPLGFGLENYNAIGRWRTKDGAFAIDASGKLPGGREFQGAIGLERLLRAQSAQFAGCLTRKLMIYALGRGLESGDKPAVANIVKHAGAEKYRFSELVYEIAASPEFQMRRPERALADAPGAPSGAPEPRP